MNIDPDSENSGQDDTLGFAKSSNKITSETVALVEEEKAAPKKKKRKSKAKAKDPVKNNNFSPQRNHFWKGCVFWGK